MLGFISALLIYAPAFFHPFYISMTDINYNNKTKAVEVSVRIFTDDFEKTLRKSCNCKIDLLATGNENAMTAPVQSYIKKHLQLKIDGQIKELEFKGYQKEEESTWSYFEIKDINNVKRLDITNSLLHDYKEEQVNMLHIKANGKEVSDKLDFPKQNYSANF